MPPNPEANKDLQLFDRLGITPEQKQVDADEEQQTADLQARVTAAENDRHFYDATA